MPLLKGDIREGRAIIPVGVFKHEPPFSQALAPRGKNRCRALIDTGATMTAISAATVKNISPAFLGKWDAWTASEHLEVDAYKIFLSIPILQMKTTPAEDGEAESRHLDADMKAFRELSVAECAGASGDYDVLLGMDVLADCLLVLQFGEFVLGYPRQVG